MRVLLLAPQPFFSERGTPIAVYNLAKALGDAGHQITLITFSGDRQVDLPNTHIIYVNFPGLKRLGPLPVGFSFRKILLDGWMLIRAMGPVIRHRYDVLHAVEESVFIALILRLLRPRARIIYDMDSSISEQLIEGRGWLAPVKPVFEWAEAFAIRRADQVLAVCQALADKVQGVTSDSAQPTPVTVIEDVADNAIGDDTVDDASQSNEDIRSKLPDLPHKMLYVGNLEPYQGVGLVVEAMAEPPIPKEVGFIVIGGLQADIADLEERAKALGIAHRIAFLGPRPVSLLPTYLAQADSLISPRAKGVNTPMKIYTYLGAGKPIIATNIASHTQVLDDSNACLVAPTPAAICDGIAHLLTKPDYARAIASKAAIDARERFSYRRFAERVRALYQGLNASAER